MPIPENEKHLNPIQRAELRTMRTLLAKAEGRVAAAKAKYDAEMSVRDSMEERVAALEVAPVAT